MAIPEGHRNNFNTLLRAAQAGHLALMECTERESGRTRYVICAVGRDGGDITMTPFGHLYDEEPFDPFGHYIPPMGNGATNGR